MNNQQYLWFVKKGRVTLQKNGDCIALYLDVEKEDYCLLTHSDTVEIIELLTTLSKQIWEGPNYKRIPYTHQLFTTNNNSYSWKMEHSKLILNYNELEKGVEMKCLGNPLLNLELNYVVEIIQILEHLNK